jgi:hypothetical protein
MVDGGAFRPTSSGMNFCETKPLLNHLCNGFECTVEGFVLVMDIG